MSLSEQPHPQPHQPPYGHPPPGYPYVVVNPTNGMAVAALVCSLAGLVTCVSAPVGAVLGHVARRQIRERDESGDGMALAGVIVGWIAFVIAVIATVLIIIFVVWAANQPPSTFDSTSGY